ncbi:electron transporter RnfC [Pseudodesulfovibrio sp. zrk46]|uniref:electron transporter RnfC n=1 Tax=Pseudodesulfovibrio sp. zrk46 TaxID=2725288 RepID=UPI001449D6CD|nr:electron transporter RnfC [Pseudodesulfovibrio sp. zrk46]QJB57973.1 electron transporter RnfC [Pseudodesulfovibrio sp. zrk46]
MTTFSFSLLTGETGPLVKGNEPPELRVPIHMHTILPSPGDQVLAGTKIATANISGLGDVHAPSSGTIKEIADDHILIEVTGEDRTQVEKVPMEDVNVRKWLREQGINVGSLYRATTLIINAVPPEPGISMYEPLLRDYRKTVELGLETVKRIVTPSKMYLVTAKGNRANAFPNCTVTHVSPTYPNGLDPMVIRAVTGQEVLLGTKPAEAVLLSVRDLFFIGKVVETGRPLTETVMTIGSQNHLIKIGTPVGWLTQEAGAAVQPGDRVILGGLMRGMPALNLQQGVDKDTTGLMLIRNGEGLNPTDNFCLGCGECERHCPARIMPGMLSRCSEFKQYDRAEDFHIHSCIECGICGYWCKAQRPLLQYIRHAKYELALLRLPNQTDEAISHETKEAHGGER